MLVSLTTRVHLDCERHDSVDWMMQDESASPFIREFEEDLSDDE